MNHNFYSSEYNESSTNGEVKTMDTTVSIFIKSYLWMFVAVLITFLVGLVCTLWLSNIIMSANGNGLLFFIALTVVSFVVQMILCYKINKNSLVRADFKKSMIQMFIFAALNGFTFSTLFIYFNATILYQVFGIVTIYYLLLSGLTYLFRNKIHKAATFAYIGLITLLIVSILTTFYSLFAINDENLSLIFLVVSIFGLIVFTIITMVDIRHMYTLIKNASDPKSASVAAAFSLYLDFINIFIYVLRIVAILSSRNRKS